MIFETVDEVVEYLNNNCYKFSSKLATVLKKIVVHGKMGRMEMFLPQDEKHEYDINFGLDRVVAIFATEDEIEYIWQTEYENNFGYEAMAVDREEIAKALTEYIKYVKDGGCLGVSEWIFDEYCDSWLSLDYDVMTTIGRIWR